VRSPTREVPRHDPKIIWAVHAGRAAGLAVAEIAAKHGLALPVVLGFLKSSADSCTLLGPYEFHRAPVTATTAIHMYWLGYIAASGRLFGQSVHGTLVLAIHVDDAGQMDELLQDLTIGHAACEFADSSLSGRQAYLRNPGLARVLVQWGLAESPERGSIQLEYVPAALVPDFLRGYIEGSRLTPPFSGDGRRLPSPATFERLTLVGAQPLIRDLCTILADEYRINSGTVTAHKSPGLAQVTFGRPETKRLLTLAYRSPVRSTPRAAKFAAKFGR
jgi:hypothetical protein